MQRNSKGRRRNEQKRKDFEANLHAVPDHSAPRSPSGARPADSDGMARAKASHPVSRRQGPPQRTAEGLWLRTERDGTPMINVGLTEAQITEMILLIDDEEGSAEPNEEVLDACRRKFVNRLNRMKQIIEEQEAAQASQS